MTMKELLQSEELCLTYRDKSCAWLRDLYSPTSHGFHISASVDQPLPRTVAPNVATSHIGVVVHDLLRSNLPLITTDEKRLQKSVLEARAKFVQTPPKELLPLHSFGALPLFSTSFLHEFLALDDSCFSNPSFAITSRRLLYLVFDLLIRDTDSQDEPHPYLLYRLARNIVLLRGLLNVKRTDFIRQLRDESGLSREVPDEPKFGELLGFAGRSADFNRRVLSRLGSDSLARLLQLVERCALNSASTELAWHSTPRKDRADPTALLFASATLTFLNPSRHDILISESTKILFAAFGPGNVPARKPFNIDDRGRALFVATLECARVLMDMVLVRFPRLTEPELSDLLRATHELQAHVIEDANEILCRSSKGTSPRLGWCSDRAFSRTRIDSWVTVEAYAFFRKRLQLIGLTKKQFVLARYSWLPPSRCQKWDKLVDPNLGEAASTLVLQRIEGIVSDASEQANLFLLHGPPGTGKTALVEGLAQNLGWELITLSPSDFVVDSLDQIEHRSRELFVHMMNVERCVILFDEMDTLLRDRQTLGESSPGMMIEFVVPALLPKLQQFRDHIVGRQLAAFFVTNFYERLDGAISRAGRLDHHLLILPYTHEARCEVGARILGKRIKNKKRLAAACKELAEVLNPFPCNLTYRDVEWICNALLNGRQGRAEIEGRHADMGISPTVYSHKKRPGAFRELFAFMKRYRSQPLRPSAASVTTQQIADYFGDCKNACPDHLEFFSQWVSVLQPVLTPRE